MNALNYIVGFFVLMIAFGGCSEESVAPINQDSATPDPVYNVQPEGLPGAVRISYALPETGGLLYVEAEVTMKNGEKKQVRSSYYNNSVLIEGFGNTDAHEVKLYSVGRNMRRSEPVSVVATPLQPAIWDVYQSLDVAEDFGGFRLTFNNTHRASVSIGVSAKDETGAWVPAQTFYTSQAAGMYAIRGFSPEKRTFGISVKDRWGNETDVFEAELTPLYEERLDPRNFRQMFAHLSTEAPGWTGGSVMSNLWSGNFVGTTNTTAWYRTNETSGIPHHFTFDLGVTAQLSRYVFWQRGAFDREDLLYSGGSARKWEIWGSTNPSADGSFNGWTLLRECEVIKPSGLAGTAINNEDIAAAQAGHEFSIPFDSPPVRYIRIRILETWGKTTYMWMSELQFYGQLK